MAPLDRSAEDAGGPAVGNLVHRALRIYHDAPVSALSPFERRKRLFEALERILPLHGDDGLAGRERASRILERYLACPLAATDASHLEAEVNLRLEIVAPPPAGGPFLLRGFADRIDISDGDIHIIDYKSHAYSPGIHAAYARQLALYLAASRRGLFGEGGRLTIASASLLYLTPDGARLEPVDPDLPAFETAAAATVARIRAERSWSPGSGAPCADCAWAVFCSPPRPAVS